MNPEIFFSYIIPTIGRVSLKAAVQSVLSQEFSQADFEVIVVNDSGKPLPKAEWQNSPRVRIITTNRSERSFARNSGAAIARGRYLAFLDDDDWILPGALECFWQLANANPNAAWLYGGIRVVDERDTILAEINSGLSGNCFAQIMGGAWAPIQASVIQARAFFESGGFNPLIGVTEDEDLCRRIAYRGEFASIAQVVACLFRGHSWDSTSNYRRAPEDVKYSRHLILSEQGAFSRLRLSATTDFWHGRIIRIYLSTISWNFKKRRYFTALGRLSYSILAALLSLHRLASRDYWAGLVAHHAPDTLHFVMEQYNRTHRPPEKSSLE